MIPTENWEVPAVYISVEQETAAARAGLALADISSFAKFSVQGPGLAELTRSLVGLGSRENAERVSSCFLVGDAPALACRLTEDHLLLLASGPRLEVRVPGFEVCVSALEIDGQYPSHLHVFNQTSALAGISLVGPKGDALLHQLTALDISDALAPGSCVQTNLAGIHALLVRSLELTVPSLRIYVSWDLAEYLWTRLLEVGRRWEVVPLGLESWLSLRA
jgi:glycine cleavage system aminomethyltransferase T